MSSKQNKALSKIIDLIDKWRTDGVIEHWQYSQLFDIADAALAEPLRNCDVGTAEEQSKRFKKYCAINKSFEWGCEKCPIFPYKIIKCEFIWSQMPYEEGGVK